jgi:very-short-patch-repair endonuclease
MHIFSSMGSGDIIAGSTAKRGVHALRDFLRFCETGILHKTERETGRAPESDFEIAVMAAIRKEGFECIPQVGVAGFYIDVAVVDPGNPGRYLMGIECDGATYHSAKSVRDRDRLRQTILERLGWRIRRIWSTDWFATYHSAKSVRDRDRLRQTILERLGWRIRRIWSTDWFKNPHAELQPIIRELNAQKTERIEDYQLEAEPETDDIEEIIEEVEEREAVTEKYISEEIGLRDKLVEFDREVIRKEVPDTPENQRLLRQAMIEAFLEYMPVDKSEFLEFMPLYLRESTNANEGKFLKDILKIINASAEVEEDIEERS